jgi:hypothetical protein
MVLAKCLIKLVGSKERYDSGLGDIISVSPLNAIEVSPYKPCQLNPL